MEVGRPSEGCPNRPEERYRGMNQSYKNRNGEWGETTKMWQGEKKCIDVDSEQSSPVVKFLVGQTVITLQGRNLLGFTAGGEV